MASVKLSPKYQIVIPKDVRERMKLRPGQEMAIMDFNDRILRIIPLKPTKEMRGFAKGINTTVRRHRDRL